MFQEFRGYDDSMFNETTAVGIIRTYNPNLVALSAIISLLGSVTGVYVMREYPSARLRHHKCLLLAAFTLVISGNTIWTMHICGIFAMEFHFIDQVKGEILLANRYRMTTLMISFIPCYLLVLLGTIIASMDPFFAKDDNEKFESLNRMLSLKQIMKRRASHVKFKALFARPGYMICGGIISGVAVTAMHYIGVTAKDPDHYKIVYNIPLMVTAMGLCIIVVTTAYWLIFRLLQWKSDHEGYRVTSAVFITTGALILHYVGNEALHYEPVFVTPNKTSMDDTIEVEIAFIYALGMSMFFLATVYTYLLYFILFVSNGSRDFGQKVTEILNNAINNEESMGFEVARKQIIQLIGTMKQSDRRSRSFTSAARNGKILPNSDTQEKTVQMADKSTGETQKKSSIVGSLPGHV